MQVPSRKMIIAVIVDGHLFPELRHRDAKMCRRRAYLTTQRCKGCRDIIVNSLTRRYERNQKVFSTVWHESLCESKTPHVRNCCSLYFLARLGGGKLGSLGRGSELSNRLRSCRLPGGGFGCSSVSTSSTPSAS